jgi:cell division protein ZapA (FtsZ GTPase activity inhibitor)
VTLLHVVSVQIAGEEYTIRTQASPEYTRDCAAHVDRTINEIMSAGAIIQAHKAGILAALAVTDQLFETRREVTDLRAQVERLATQLASEVEGHLGATDLAARS